MRVGSGFARFAILESVLSRAWPKPLGEKNFLLENRVTQALEALFINPGLV